MEEAVYGDVLDVLVELREAVLGVMEVHQSADASTTVSSQPQTPQHTTTAAETICREQSPALLEKLDTLSAALETILRRLSDSTAPPLATAEALRTLVRRKLGDVMESAHHVRALTLQAGSNSQSASWTSNASSTGSSEHRASEMMKARQVFRTATQNLEDAQRLLRIAYSSVLSSSYSSPASGGSGGVAGKGGDGARPNRHAQGNPKAAADDVVRYSIGSNNSGTGTGTSTDRGSSLTFPEETERGTEEDDGGDGGASAPRASDHTAPYHRRSGSRDCLPPRGSSGSSGGDDESSSAARALPGSRGARGGKPAEAPVVAPPAATPSQWWFEPSNSAESANGNTTTTTAARDAPRGRGTNSQRRVSFLSVTDSEDTADRDKHPSQASDHRSDDDDDSGLLPHTYSETMRYRSEEIPTVSCGAVSGDDPSLVSSANISGGAEPALDLAYFQSSSPITNAMRRPNASSSGKDKAPGAAPGLPTKPPLSTTTPPNQYLSAAGNASTTTNSSNSGNRHSPRGSPKGSDGALSPPNRPIVNPDGTHTTRHAQRLPGELWRHVIATDADALHNALCQDVVDLFNYGEETPLVEKEKITGVTFTHLDGYLHLSFLLTHKASLSATDIDLRLAIFSFPEMTALYEEHFLEIQQRELSGERVELEKGARKAGGEVEERGPREDASNSNSNNDASTSSWPAHGGTALEHYRWPSSEAATSMASLTSYTTTGRRPSDFGLPRPHPARHGSGADFGDSSSSDRTVSLIPENSRVSSLTPTSAAALRHFQQENLQQQPSSRSGEPTSSHHSVTIPGPHWDRVVAHVTERVCRLLVVDEIASALSLPSTSVGHVEFRYGSLVVDYNLFAGPGEMLPPADLVEKVMGRCTFPVLRRVYDDTCNQLGLNPADREERAQIASLPTRAPGIQFTLPDKDALDKDSDEDSIRRRRATRTTAPAATRPKLLPEPSATPPTPTTRTVGKAPPLASRATAKGVGRRARDGGGDSPDPQPSLGTPPRPFTSSGSREHSQESPHTPPQHQQQQQLSALQLNLTPMDDEPTTLLHLSLMHGVPVPVLREWNPHLHCYGDEDTIPDSVAVTVPRAYGLEEEEEYNDEDDGEGEARAEHSEAALANSNSALQHSLMSRSRGSTGTTRSSVGGSRPRENVKFVSVGSPSSPRHSQHTQAPPPPAEPLLRESEASASCENANQEEEGGGGPNSGLSTPIASPRDWYPTPAPPPDVATLSKYRRASEERAREEQQQQPQQGQVDETKTGRPDASARRVSGIRVLAVTPVQQQQQEQPEQQQQQEQEQRPPPSKRAPIGSARGRKIAMPPPLTVKIDEEQRQQEVSPSRVPRSEAAKAESRESPSQTTPSAHGRRTPRSRRVSHEAQAVQESEDLTPHQQRMLKAQPPPLSTSLVDQRKSVSTAASTSQPPPRDALAAAVVEQHQQKRASSQHREIASARQPRQEQPYVKPVPRAPQASTESAAPFKPMALPQQQRQQEHHPSEHVDPQHPSSAASLVSASISRAESAGAGGGDNANSALRRPPPEVNLVAWLGLHVDTATLTVTRAQGQAAKTGFRRGDVIRTVDGKAVRSVEEFGGYVAPAKRRAVFVTVQEARGGPVTTRHVGPVSPAEALPSLEGRKEQTEEVRGARDVTAAAVAVDNAPRTGRTASAGAGRGGGGLVRSASRGTGAAARPAIARATGWSSSVGASARRPGASASPVPIPSSSSSVAAASAVSSSRERSHETHYSAASVTTAATATTMLTEDPRLARPRAQLMPPSQRLALARGAIHERRQLGHPATLAAPPEAPASARVKIRSRSANPSAIVVPLGPARSSATARRRKLSDEGDKEAPGQVAETVVNARRR